MFYVRDGSSLLTQPLLVALHLILAIRQSNRVSVSERVARKESVAVKRLPVLARSVNLKAAAFVQVYVAGGECVVEFERFGNLTRDESVFSSRHPVIKLCEQ